MLPGQVDLFVRYRKHPSIELRNRLVNLNLKLAYDPAHKYARCSNEPFDDLFQEAMLALTAAVERFNPHAGTAFSSLAVPIIEGRLKNYFRDKGSTIKWPRKTYEQAQKIRRFERQLLATLGRQPKPIELASAMDLTIEQLKQIQEDIRNCRFLAAEENASRKPGQELAIQSAIAVDLSHVGEIEQEAFDLVFGDRLPFGQAAHQLGCTEKELSIRLRNFYKQAQLKAA